MLKGFDDSWSGDSDWATDNAARTIGTIQFLPYFLLTLEQFETIKEPESRICHASFWQIAFVN